MRLQDYEILEKRITGKDRLDNDTYEYVPMGTFKGRLTSWSSENVNTLGREFTMSHRKVIAFPGRDKLEKGSKVRIGDDVYEVVTVLEPDRWRILHVKGYRI